ncbi:cell surface protein SprA, partial [candidate division GN15 bacterium]|nr:cell surface protein SprA [candidate division GN15 bacterium]
NQDLQGLRNAEVFVNVRDKSQDSTFAQPYLMRRIEGAGDFELLYGQPEERCPIAIQFKSSKTRNAIGVYMEVLRYGAGGVVDTLIFGSVDQGDADTLQFLRPSQAEYNPQHPTWDLMWRNAYRIPRTDNIADLEIKVYKGLPGTEGNESNLDYQLENERAGDRYIKILGLDQYNNNRLDSKQPDNKVDDLPEIFRPDWGLLIFPDRAPFASDTQFVDDAGNRTDTLVTKVPDIYDYTSSNTKIEASQYYLSVSTTTRSSVIRLGRANIIEESERVTLNGRVLKRGTDYNIQYDFGQITLLAPEALDPNADIQVDFQYAPFLSLQKKTLLGLRAEYDWSDDLSFGSTLLYKSDKAEDRKPRVGQETAKALVMAFDMSFGLRPNFLTKMVDAIPLVSTEAESRMQVSAEIAHSRPNPNVDGVAYVDDFESAIERLPLGIPRVFWTHSSLPFPLEVENETATEPWIRGAMRWHNPPPVLRQDVYEGEVAAGEGSLTPLRLIFRPRPSIEERVEQDSVLVCTGNDIPTRSWGGMMRYFANRVDEKRVKLFEMRAKGGKGVLHFDFGQMREDVNGNGIRDTEDRGDPGNGSLDGEVDDPDREDRGLDLILDNDEISYCGEPYDPTTNPDPHGDNWWFEGDGAGSGGDNERPPVPLDLWNSPGYRDRVNDIDDWLHYEWINGTEGNVNDAGVQGIPDDEALRPGVPNINPTVNYLTVAVPLNTDPSNPFLVPGSGRNGWYTYRIPVREPGVMDTVRSDESAQAIDWSQISWVRVWFEKDSSLNDGIDSLQNIDSVWIAEWGFIQSNWSDTLIRVNELDTASEFYVASVSEEDGTFTPPPGVEAYTDKVNNVTETQRALSLVYQDLDSGDVALSQKFLVSAESYSGYRKIEMYVHGPEDMGSDPVQFFFRLGRDSINYYEYQVMLQPGWDPDNNVIIDFNELTALKDAADRNLEGNARIDTTAFPYRVVGRPNINETRFLAAGIKNVGSNRISGEVWIDELRVTDVRKDPGTAVRADISGTMADFITYSLSYEHRDPYFRGLSQATRGGSQNNLGSGRENTQFNYSSTLNLHKFLPRSWNARLPITFGYIETEEIP